MLGSALDTSVVNGLERYGGNAYASEDGALLYTETHWLYRDGNVDKRFVLYRCADGTPFARKSVTETLSATAPDFDFFDARLGYREGVGSDGKHRFVYYQRRQDVSPSQRELQFDTDDVIDAGFDAYVRAHWDQISSDRSLHAAIVVPGRLSTVPVAITEEKSNDPEIRRLTMRLDSWFRFVTAPIYIDYQRSNRRLVAFQGIGTIRDVGGHNMNVRIRFPQDQHRTSVDSNDLVAAQHTPLRSTCNR